MKVLNFGSLNVDSIFRVKNLVKSNETIDCKLFQVSPGGKGLNQSVAIRKAGITDIYHAGNIGMDGELLLFSLIEHGVKTNYIKRSNSKAGHAFIQVADNADHTIIIERGSNMLIEKEYIDEVLSNFGKGDFLLLQNEISNIAYIIDEAYKRGMKIFLNPAPFTESVFSYDINKVDTLIINKKELLLICRTDNYNLALEVIKKYKINILLTLGKAGGIYFSKDNMEYCYEAWLLPEQLDTTAIGDTFVGYFIAGLAKGNNVQEVLEVCSKAAALTAMKIGAANSIPTINEVMCLSNSERLKR